MAKWVKYYEFGGEKIVGWGFLEKAERTQLK